jgi:hypothetical protein
MELNIDANDDAFLQKLSHETNIHIERILIDSKLEITLDDLEKEIKLDDNYLYVINFSNQTISNYNVYYSVDISNNVEHRIFNILNKNSLFIENYSYLFIKFTPFEYNCMHWMNSFNTEQKKQEIMVKQIRITDSVIKKAKHVEYYNKLTMMPQDKCIYILYENNNNERIINDNLCEEIIDFFDKYPIKRTERWESGQNVNCKFIKLEECCCNPDDVIKIKAKELDDRLFKSINQAVTIMTLKYDIRAGDDCGYCIRKIYGPTRDHKDGLQVNNINNVLPNNKIRVYSLIIALNDDYDGGEIYFRNQGFKHKLKKGEIIVFPPYWTHPHFTFPLLNSTYRYTINTWLYEEPTYSK